jgi:hypothetical protein
MSRDIRTRPPRGSRMRRTKKMSCKSRTGHHAGSVPFRHDRMDVIAEPLCFPKPCGPPHRVAADLRSFLVNDSEGRRRPRDRCPLSRASAERSHRDDHAAGSPSRQVRPHRVRGRSRHLGTEPLGRADIRPPLRVGPCQGQAPPSDPTRPSRPRSDTKLHGT